MTTNEQNDIRLLIEHVETDIKYREGGTFHDDGDDVDLEAVKAAKRAIRIIQKTFNV